MRRSINTSVTTELPLTKGARYDHESEHLTLTDVLTQPDGVDVTLRQRRMHLLFDPHNDDANPYAMLDRANEVYLLLNKTLHQAVIQKQDLSMNFSMFSKRHAGEPAAAHLLRPGREPVGHSAFPKLDKAWLANAVLVRLDLVPVVAFNRTITVPGFRMDGKFSLPDANSTAESRRRRKSWSASPCRTMRRRSQVRTYIKQIVAICDRRGASKADPQGMLEKVGPQNLDLLIEALQSGYNYHLERAIDDMVQPDQKQLILQALPDTPGLINTVVNHGWQEEARPAVLAGLTGDTQRSFGSVDRGGGVLQGSIHLSGLAGLFRQPPEPVSFPGLPVTAEFRPGRDGGPGVETAGQRLNRGRRRSCSKPRGSSVSRV